MTEMTPEKDAEIGQLKSQVFDLKLRRTGSTALLAMAENVLREIAATEPVWESDGFGRFCIYCAGFDGDPFEHEPTCAWIKAQEFLAALKRPI